MKWMKNLTGNINLDFLKLSGIALLLTVATSCEEKGPNIRLEPPLAGGELKDTTYRASSDTTAQDKNILLEEFTGVRCNNCPKAAKVIDELKSDYGDKLIALSIHCGNFSTPYKENKENYRLDKGQAIYNWFGTPPQPTGMIDRFKFSGENDEILRYPQWKSNVSKRSGNDAKVSINMSKLLNKNERQLKSGVRVRFHESVKEIVYLTLVLTEDNIIDYQLTPNGKKADYEHDYVARKIVTPSRGLRLFTNPESRRVVYKEFSMKLEDHWKIKDLNLIAFVHVNQSANTVFQAQKLDIQE